MNFSETKNSEKLLRLTSEKEQRRHTINKDYLFHSRTDKNLLGISFSDEKKRLTSKINTGSIEI